MSGEIWYHRWYSPTDESITQQKTTQHVEYHSALNTSRIIRTSMSQIVQRYVTHYPASIIYKSTAGRYRPVSYPDGPITARYRFKKNAYWVSSTTHKSRAKLSSYSYYVNIEPKGINFICKDIKIRRVLMITLLGDKRLDTIKPSTPQLLYNTFVGVHSINRVKQLCYIRTQMYRLY